MSKVVVSLYGGLGNQLFQYATGYALSKHLNVPLVLDLGWFDVVGQLEQTTPRKFALAPFKLNAEEQHVGLDFNPKAQNAFERIFKRLNFHKKKTKNKTKVIKEKHFQFDPTTFENAAPLWLDGYWQSPKYFEKWTDDLKSQIGTPGELNLKTQEMMSKILGTDSICLHVRRGDYVTNSKTNRFHGVCSLDYYREGVKRVVGNLSKPHCFVFSDDPEWTRKHLDVGLPTTVVDVNGPDDAHQDLWLMAACKSFVIANSSLSWWAAWLCKFKNKSVVAPLNWFQADARKSVDLIPVDWIRI